MTPALSGRMRATSAWGLVVLACTTSFAAVDWIMSLDPHWVSTVFGVYFWSGALLSSLAAIILSALSFRRLGSLEHTITVEHLHDLGKLLFGFVIFWTYIAFSQYLLIWYANLPREMDWYITRRTGNWNDVTWRLVFGGFLVPFVILLSRTVRREPIGLGLIAGWVLVFHYVDLYWLVMPTLRSASVIVYRIDVSVCLTVVCFYCAVVVHACQRRAVVPVGDPQLEESVAFQQS